MTSPVEGLCTALKFVAALNGICAGGGYELVDKEGTKYTFTVAKSTGVYGVTGIADAAGRRSIRTPTRA